MTCHECADFLADYVSGELLSEQLAVFERHLTACPNCVEYMRQYSATIRAGRKAFSDTATDVPEELVRAILAARKSPNRSS